MPLMLRLSFVGLSLLGAGCAATGGGAAVPADALTVASVRHTAGPQPEPVWIARAALPADARRSDGERALLLEVELRDDRVVRVEDAPLELANVVVRVEARTRRETVIAVQSALDRTLAFDLFVSSDGERFRAIPACPVAARSQSFERWPERVAWVAVGNLRAASGLEADCAGR
jgi:hypothetical protein